MAEFSVGRSRVEKIHELDLDGFAATKLLPGLDPHLLGRHPDGIPPGTCDADGNALLSVHSWLIRHEGRIILVDTGAGNGKSRPGLAVLDQLRTPYLERLAAAGVRPEDVDTILLTHIHADHVGWNTSRVGEGWVPTFPNATVTCSRREWRYGAALAAGDDAQAASVRAEAGLGDPVRVPEPGVFADSMLPLRDAGRVRFVDVDGTEILPGIRFVATPGHSIDHAAIELSSAGELAVFGGDVMHHPLEVHDPDLLSMFCEFPDAARSSRRRLLRRLADTEGLFFSSHFPLSSAGHVAARGDAYAWTFAEVGVTS